MAEKITLVERNVDCANITKDEFVQAIKEIVTEAINAWYNYQLPQCEEYNKRYVADQQARIIDFANKKYKRPSYRNAYIEKAISEIDTNKSKPYELGSVLFDVEPDQLGTPLNCYIDMDNPDIIKPLRNHPFVVEKINAGYDLADIFFEFHMKAINISDDECSKYGISRETADQIVGTIRDFGNEFYNQKVNGSLLNTKNEFPQKAMIYNRAEKNS